MSLDPKVISEEDLGKLHALENPKVMEVVTTYVNLCKPRKVSVITDDEKDIAYVRKLSIDNGEENTLKIPGHTYHFDGYFDQARDKKNTRILVSEGQNVSPRLNSIEREKGLAEVLGFLDGAMEGKEALIRFFCLGPRNSKFSILALQITDSAYVAHSEDLLYRPGYEEFRHRKKSDFFYFIHSAGQLENNVSKNIENRRIYIDLKENRVFSVNNQYGGNSIGLKKLALRLAINKAVNEDWLAEHMFIMAVHPEGKSRVTYMLGAYPSMCGKTSTAMIPGQTIVGDDIAYLRLDDSNRPIAANIERGIFGIIKDVNPVDDPVIYNVLTSPNEIIFSNILVSDGTPYWIGMGKEPPETGVNYAGKWHVGKKGPDGRPVTPSHPNARYTVKLSDLENCDPALEEPDGVVFEGIFYGGRDSDISVPVYQSLSWEHGVFIGATIESETTAATLGAQGVRVLQPMANLDFIVVPLGKYIQAHLDYGKRLSKKVYIFATNYFLRDENGKFYDSKLDKKIWLLWAEGRVHGEYEAIETPIGHLPRYEDLKALFKQVFDLDYRRERYEAEFAIRVQKYLEKLDRVEAIYRKEADMPSRFFEELTSQRSRLLEAKKRFGTDVISPSIFY
ncbi:MAG: phosphoenolpyruvate carboxykinase (GTP) [Candidatus Ranarchaeia archaeon]